MAPTLPVSRLINVDVVLTPLAAQAQDLSTLLILGNSDVIDVTERLRAYDTIAAVVDDFGVSAVEYLAAVLWFEQAPQPNQLKIGRWAQTATRGKLLGGGVSAANRLIAPWNAVVTPGFFVYLDGVPFSIAPASLAAQTNLNGIATLIQTALAAALAATTCVWNATLGRFEIESGTSGAGSKVSFLTPPTATGKFTFAGQPAANDTITLNGTVVTFVAGAPAALQVQIGGTIAATLVNLLTFLQASVDVQLVKFTYAVVGSVLYATAAATGAGGNALTIAKAGANIAVSGATLAGGSTTDISTMLAGLSSSSGAYVADGIAAEAADAAAALFDSMFGQTWYALTMPTALDADHLLVSAYIEACDNKHIYGVSTQEAGVLSAVSTTDIAYLLDALGYARTLVQYSSTNAYAVCSLLGRALTVNYNGNNTVITLMYKQEPGIVAESVSASQIAALEGKNCNIFVNYNNDTAIIEQGKVCSGAFIDEITGTDWLAVTIMTAVYNLLYTSPTKIPQTDAGVHLIVVVIEGVCSIGVTNDLLAPGTWGSQGFGTLQSGDFMPKGFYVYAPPVATQLQADREARKSPVIQVAAKLSGAVHTVDIIINVNR